MDVAEAAAMLSRHALELDAAAEVARITASIAHQVLETLRRRGAVVGVSGGIDSSVVAALAARALGPENVLCLMMPEHHSSDESLRLGQLIADWLGVEALIENIGPALESSGCYARQTEAIQRLVPEYGEGWKCKLSLPSILDGDRLNVARLTVQSPTGELKTVRVTSSAYSQLVAATNYKQRLRKVTEYYHADRLRYAVAGTPNRLEYDQGFFVKQGDGAADFKPIAHLYKSQVYQIARHLGVPEPICARPPTTDTFSLAQTQEEFYFALPYQKMDLCLYAFNHSFAPEDVAEAVELTAEQVGRVFKDIAAKRRATRYLHERPLLVERVAEV